MTGIFDSGVGGFASYNEIRRLLPCEDILYLADREGAPYGTKNKETLIPLIRRDILRLKERGAQRILIACCTASALWQFLTDEEKEISFPIISPSAELSASLGERITVIATDYTARCGAFSEEIKRFNPRACVTEISAQGLVSLVECGARDGALGVASEEAVERVCRAVGQSSPDVLILGCTHFSHLEGEIGKRLPKTKLVTPAVVGAREFVKKIKKEKSVSEHGFTLYM